MQMIHKTVYAADIKENTHVEDIFLVGQKNMGATRNGKPYIALTVSDKTGILKARVWDNAEKLSRQFSAGNIVKLKANAVLYQGDIQLNINNIVSVAHEDSDLRMFLPSSENDPEECYRELFSFIDTIGDVFLKKLLTDIFTEDNIQAAFKKAPAAKSVHHDYIGGLLDHTLNVVRLADAVAPLYKNLDRDLLVAGALLHDLGKIEELSFDKNFDYTDIGRLIGHIIIGADILTEHISQIPEFPKDLALVVKHMILSHHGKFEFGSPKRPKTLEAMMLHYLDDIDSKICAVSDFIEKDAVPESKWTGYHRLMDRFFYTESRQNADTDSKDNRD